MEFTSSTIPVAVSKRYVFGKDFGSRSRKNLSLEEA